MQLTTHAIQRYRQRIGATSDLEAHSQLITAQKAVDAAAAFRCPTVVMGNGAGLVLKGDTVITVLPKRGSEPVGGYGKIKG